METLAVRIGKRLFAHLHARRGILERFAWSSPQSLPLDTQEEIQLDWSQIILEELEPARSKACAGGRAGVDAYATARPCSADVAGGELSLGDWLGQSEARRVCVQRSMSGSGLFLAILQVGPTGHGIATHWGRAGTAEGAIRGALHAWTRDGLSVHQLARLQRTDLGLTEQELEQLATNVRLPHTPDQETHETQD